jgi:hypothetical protein
MACYRRIADLLHTKSGYKIVMDRDCRQSLPGEIQDDWSLVHFPIASVFLSIVPSSMDKLIWGLTHTNMNIFFCHFTRSGPVWKALIRKLLRLTPVLRRSRMLRHPVLRKGLPIRSGFSYLCVDSDLVVSSTEGHSATRRTMEFQPLTGQAGSHTQFSQSGIR